ALRVVQGGRQVGGRDTTLLKRLHLVLHQGDQRGDDDAGARQQQPRQLIDQALAAASRCDQQQAPTLEQGLYGLCLARPKGWVAKLLEPRLERVAGELARRGGSCCVGRGRHSGVPEIVTTPANRRASPKALAKWAAGMAARIRDRGHRRHPLGRLRTKLARR